MKDIWTLGRGHEERIGKDEEEDDGLVTEKAPGK